MKSIDKKYELGILEDRSADELLPFDHDFFSLKDKNILVLGGSETFSTHRQKRYCEIVEEQAFPDLYLNTEILKTQTEGYENHEFMSYLMPFMVKNEEQFRYTKEQYKQMEFAQRRDEYYRNRCNIIGMRYLGEERAEYYAAELLRDVFLSQIAKKNGKRWQRIDANIVAQNLRKWVIFGHCFGDRIARYMDFLMRYQMLKIGYSIEETSYIQRQMTVFGHNSMVESVGQENRGFLYFERMLAKDGEYKSKQFPQDSFQSYFQRMKILSNKVYLVPLNEQEIALLVATTNDKRKVSSVVISEHDKGYWKSTECKPIAAQKEERIFRSIFNEVLRTDYLLQNWRQVIDNSIKKSPNDVDKIHQAIKNGQSYYPFEKGKSMAEQYMSEKYLIGGKMATKTFLER